MEMIHLDAPPDLEMPIGEAMFTQRAIRRLRGDQSVSDGQLKVILDAASKAPSGGNTQPARFLVIRSREKIRAFGKLYHEAWWAKRLDDQGWTRKDQIPPDSVAHMASLLADEMVDAPVVILAFSLTPNGESSVLLGAQNIMLAARALGIGSVYTTLHPKVMDRVYDMFGIPAEAEFHGCLPLGYPRGNFGPTQRYSTSETTFWDDWDNAPPW